MGDPTNDCILLLLPTYVARSGWEIQEQVIRDFLEQVRALHEAKPLLAIVPTIAMQWMGDEKHEAETRVDQILALAKQDFGLETLCFTLESCRKLASLNRAISLAVAQNATAMFWMDDDVRLSSQALVALWRDFDRGGQRGAIGAVKIGIPQENWSSRIVAFVKGATKTAITYPHGCAIMVDFDVIKTGFPAWAHCDDGYVCFELLDPDGAEPLGKLRLCEDTTCWFPTGAGGLLDNIKRIRRMQMNQALLMAIYPCHKSKYYFKEIMFWGLMPRYSATHTAQPKLSVASLFLKAFHLYVFCTVVLELIIRGILRKPVSEVQWGGTRQMSSVAK